MSYDIYLMKGDEVAQIERHEEGGTYLIGGNTDAHLNVTYNYAGYYYEHLDADKGIRWLYGKQAKDTVERLEKAIETLGIKRIGDYWEPSSGNAGYALSILLKWAKLHPDAIFEGD